MAQPSPTSYVEAQTRYRDLSYQKALLGEIKGKRETSLAEKFTAGISAIFAVFPDFDPKKDYTIPVEASDAERPATLAEIQALANSIPIPSLGAQGSSQNPAPIADTSSGLKGYWIAGAGLLGVIAVYFLFFRK